MVGQLGLLRRLQDLLHPDRSTNHRQANAVTSGLLDQPVRHRRKLATLKHGRYRLDVITIRSSRHSWDRSRPHQLKPWIIRTTPAYTHPATVPNLGCLPWSAWGINAEPGSGRRLYNATPNASATSSVRGWSVIDQPITRRDQASTTA